MNKLASTTIATLCLFVSLSTSLLADTMVFENGFYFISAPAEFEDVVVGQGAVVAFTDDVVITGDIEVENGGFLSANYCFIGGDVRADGAAIVDLLGVTLRGDVNIKRTGGDPVLGLFPLISIMISDIHGDVKVINNDVNSITITDNLIGGKLLVKGNRYNAINVSGNQTNLNRHCHR